jgi:hypothetical protein
MDSLSILAGRIAGLVSAAAFLPYAIAIVRGRAKPSLSTWLIWTVVGGALCASHWAAGGRNSFWVALSYVLGPFTLALLALRYGERTWSPFDKVCLAAAACSLVLWALSGSPLVALCMNIMVDFIGALPTIRKSWQEPESEDRLSWSMFFAGNALNLFAIEKWSFSGAVYPLYLFLVTLTMTILLWRPRRTSGGVELSKPTL